MCRDGCVHEFTTCQHHDKVILALGDAVLESEVAELVLQRTCRECNKLIFTYLGCFLLLVVEMLALLSCSLAPPCSASPPARIRGVFSDAIMPNIDISAELAVAHGQATPPLIFPEASLI